MTRKLKVDALRKPSSTRAWLHWHIALALAILTLFSVHLLTVTANSMTAPVTDNPRLSATFPRIGTSL
jgi:hypothetical protein